jgi:hypothetical protein
MDTKSIGGLFSASDTEPFTSGMVWVYFIALLACSAFAFHSNQLCLFFDWDGVAWKIMMDQFQQFGSPFPLHGMFDATYSSYGGGLVHDVVWVALFGSGINKVATHVFYAAFLFLSVLTMCRVARLDLAVSTASAVAAPLLMLPYFSDTPVIDPVYALNPIYLYMIATMVLSIALLWLADGESPLKFAILTLAIFVLIFSACQVLILNSSYMILAGLPFAIAGVAASGDFRIAGARILCGLMVLTGIAATGIPSYLYAVGAYTVTAFFYNEGRGLSPSGDIGEFNLLRQIKDLYDVTVNCAPFAAAGLVGASLVAWRGAAKQSRIFAVSYICSIFLFTLAHILFAGNAWQQLTGLRNLGPGISRIMHFLIPFLIIFSVAAAYGALFLLARSINLASEYIAARRGRSHPVYWTRPLRLLVHSCLVLMLSATTALAFRNNPGASAKTCSRPYFWPLHETPIIAYLEKHIGVRPGSTFKGAVANFYDTQGKASVWWGDLITADWHIWYQTGNDMRSLGLWQFNIPTLFELNTILSPPYFLMTAEFLARPNEGHSRAMTIFTRPEPRILALWGVRYLIVDYPLEFGTEIMQMQVKPITPVYFNTPLRLYEIADVNVGNYSPTDVIRADTAAETIARMKSAEFDGRRDVVADTILQGTFTAAANVSLTVVPGGIDIRATGGTDSLLVLPVQYSRCWQVEGDHKAFLFRANFLQLGIRFTEILNARLRHRFGLFWNSSCRLQDVKDMQTLQISDARTK